ncbi:hypothetical protein HQO84_10815 [Rhodococcus fascians]|nr:hypothetical protein [Rhodococcus fascians]MBY3995441.1 hypothetical protein [Rhodococcus fascians]MBY4001937.1 hypothetical protein [Rhodococcus fascians]MBY4007230.1 hypothetical protein [Rhodococcus fascians]MBY4016166.1 hypothetical protein [Rhodococcus fascians]
MISTLATGDVRRVPAEYAPAPGRRMRRGPLDVEEQVFGPEPGVAHYS